jgi:hypothetical protein
MRNSLLAGASLLALFAWGARAAPYDFTYTGSPVTFTVPVTGTYKIIAFGAQGGGTRFQSDVGFSPIPGGLGAEIGGDFDLSGGDELQIAVGGAGDDGQEYVGGGGGGGGGSFVVAPGKMALVIAGGGGGAGDIDAGGNGRAGGNGDDGAAGDCGCAGGVGGTNGSGGGAPKPVLPPGIGSTGAGGGGGFKGSGGDGTLSGSGGGSFPGLAGGAGSPGGFGGGGGGYASGGGGGGGYSGGGGAFDGSGGGGGSFDAGQNPIRMAGIRSGDGEVVITYIFAGTPGTANCHGKSVSALAKQYRGLNNAAAALSYPSVSALQNAIEAYCEA